ncbi:hypothetical protein B0T17DRAFT_87938 [Bombardia bombarda]|uniref:Uncharacterized protein n=1 Tax=Bombardia bombarda TaxID=252184 RepID=A0AA39XMD5_9PEZI|nr:hypothetical protein B0T17DRAFT_87938 [Bombardia bombarda]
MSLPCHAMPCRPIATNRRPIVITLTSGCFLPIPSLPYLPLPCQPINPPPYHPYLALPYLLTSGLALLPSLLTYLPPAYLPTDLCAYLPPVFSFLPFQDSNERISTAPPSRECVMQQQPQQKQKQKQQREQSSRKTPR